MYLLKIDTYFNSITTTLRSVQPTAKSRVEGTPFATQLSFGNAFECIGADILQCCNV